jgi:hypothetical protein
VTGRAGSIEFVTREEAMACYEELPEYELSYEDAFGIPRRKGEGERASQETKRSIAMGTTNDEETGEHFFLALNCGRISDEKLLFEATLPECNRSRSSPMPKPCGSRSRTRCLAPARTT